ncbi:hypothetical protein LUZ61_006846 [Rhynchospora tenuis]|uniref:Peptidase A1 domain-containing protein n=1 Tax=Rhynchospora tenuis TaxID=198213 RepID=A0AAD5ZSC2_9POAL|nr:hypothetical protein LUZ61_006846 [Rhynchospora tenuis]
MLLAIAVPTSSKGGFTVELIDPFSPRSPIYDASLTESERIKLQTKSDKHRLCYLNSVLKINSSCNNEINSDVIRPNTRKRGYFYMVVLDLGTGASRHTYLLEFDTGSGLTWTQCNPCHPQFHQEPPLFDPSGSPTYHYVPHNHPLCKAPTYHPDRNDHCEFRYGYADGAYAAGTFSFDTFTFTNHGGNNMLSIPNLPFGCAHRTACDNPYGGPVGILGMNLDPESFIIQARQATGGRFSYCLFNTAETDAMTLRFGDDISWPWMAHRQHTRIVRYPEGLYNLNLLDISIGGTRMNLPPRTFERKSSKKGGFIIDSGTVSSTLVPKAYEVVVAYLNTYFNSLHLERLQGPNFPYELCYILPVNMSPVRFLPNMVYHFEGADLSIYYEQVFYMSPERGGFCFAMRKNREISILGSFSQGNTQFMYDTVSMVLEFASVDCAHGV